MSIRTPWGPIGYITVKRTYTRRLNENDPNSPTEEFEDVVERIIKACDKQLHVGFTKEEEDDLRNTFLELKGIVAGRFLWQLGTKTVEKLGLLSLQNCAFTLVNEPIRPFVWAMDALMLGSGVGYNIQREYVYELPKVKRVKVVRQDTKDADFIVPDSRQGWVQLLEKTLESHFITGQGFSYSTICIRGKGTPIKGFGGLASGPEELCWGIEQIGKVLNSRANKKLRPIDCLDIMNIIGYIVVSGNVRRSAQIAIGDMDDLQFLNAKRWDLGDIPSWRAMSNNSVVCNDFSKLPEQFWQGYMGNGEPYGLINLNNARRMGRVDDLRYVDPDVSGFNPSLRAGTKIWTSNGIFPIEKLQDQRFTVTNLNGESAEAKCWLSGTNKQLYKITLDNGFSYFCTPEHKWPIYTKQGYVKAETTELKPGHLFPIVQRNSLEFGSLGDRDDGFAIGWLYGDGWVTERADSGKIQYGWIVSNKDMQSGIHTKLESFLFKITGHKHSGCVREHGIEYNSANVQLKSFMDSLGVMHKSKGLPSKIWNECSEEFRKGFIDGLFSSDGTVESSYKSAAIIIGQSNEKLIQDLSELLGFYGIKNGYYHTHLASASFPNGKTYDRSYDRYVIKIASRFSIGHFRNIFTLTHKDKQSNLESISSTNRHPLFSKHHQIVSVELTDLKEDVWDVTVFDNTHCFQLSHVITGNCAEQSLADKETCCLAEIYLPNISSQEELHKVITLLYRINKHSLSLPCHLKDTEAIVHKNMRMGIGVTGYLQATEVQRSWLSDAYEYLRKYDDQYSAKHHFSPSIKLTTVKPSGCSVGSSLIVTDKGLLRLDELVSVKGSEWQTISDLKTDAGQNITKGFINGFVSTKKIYTEDGFEYESSLNHKYWVNNKEWKRCDELSTSDFFTVKLGGYEKVNEPELKTIEESFVISTMQIKQPGMMNPDLGFFLGLLTADGSIHKKGIRISFNRRDSDLIALLKKIIYNQFGLMAEIDDDHSLCANSLQLLRWLEINGLNNNYSDSLSLPKIIRESSKETIMAYINGYWRGDGGQHNVASWSLCAVTKSFAQEIAVMCRAVGMNVSIKNAGPGGYGKLDRWLICNKDTNPNRYQSEELKARYLGDGLWADPIVKIEDSANHTYDISVDNTHKYVLNGAISHNTLSLLAGVTPGAHPAYSQYYIRRMRIASNSNLIQICRDNGYHIEYQRNFDGTEDKSTFVVSFPCKVPYGTKLAKDMTAVDQLEVVKRLQTEWSDNAVSVTVYYRKEELDSIKEWLSNNYDKCLKSVSFLLHSEHGFQQAPLEEITEEQYNEMIKAVKPITGVSFKEEDVSGVDECANGVCPIK